MGDDECILWSKTALAKLGNFIRHMRHIDDMHVSVDHEYVRIMFL